MVCIAAFIILCMVGIFVAFISIFRRDIGRRYLKVFKQSFACVGKKATFQKCETGFKENVKNSLLAKILVKNPRLLRPASIIIEVLSVFVVAITIWSLVEATKAGLALWTLGTCNVEHPSSCALNGAEMCSIDGNEPQNLGEHIGQWFSDWGEIFSAIPDKFRSWDVDAFDLVGVAVLDGHHADDAPLALDIVDPGCVVCAQSFRTQLETGFFDTHITTLIPFPIRDADGKTKFANSELISRYVLAASPEVGYKIMKRIFTEYNAENRDYQTHFNYDLDAASAEKLLKAWLKEFGEDVEIVSARAYDAEITSILDANQNIVTNDIHAKGIPTMIYNNAKHTGKFSE